MLNKYMHITNIRENEYISESDAICYNKVQLFLLHLKLVPLITEALNEYRKHAKG